MSRPSQNGGVKKLADMTPEQQVLTCAWGPDAEKETFRDAFILSLAMFGENPGFNSDSCFKVGVTIAIDPEKPRGETPSDDDCRIVFEHDMDVVFQRMICKTLDAAYSGNVTYLRDLAKFLEANEKKKDVTDNLRIWFLKLMEELRLKKVKPLTILEICQRIPNEIDDRPPSDGELQRHMRRVCRQMGYSYRAAKEGRPPKAK